MPIPVSPIHDPVHPSNLAECQALQKEEYEVLESIYPECVSSQITEGTLKLEIPVEFEHPRKVVIIEDRDSATSPIERPSRQDTSLSLLPLLLIHLILPPSYPLTSPPQFVSIRTMHMWLPKAALLQAALLEMWQPGEGTLYTWIEFIRTGEFLSKLELISLIDHNTICLPHPAPHLLAPLLIAYEETSKSDQFSRNSYPCTICLTSLKGSKCLKLSCDHIFCRSCLEDFWKLCIEEGDIGRVQCPDPACIKAGRDANEEEVARVVSEAEVQRWRWLREKRNLEKDPSIVHCPLDFCQAPVTKPAELASSSGWDRYRECPKCSFSFCAFCRRTWHGPITNCPIADSERVVLEYLAASEASAGRKHLELRFGRANVLKLVALYNEEQANKQWLNRSTTECPGCQCRVEKSLGCNHMTCWKCNQHFCYRCGVRLQPAHPYIHFSTPGNPCFNKLFDFVDEDRD